MTHTDLSMLIDRIDDLRDDLKDDIREIKTELGEVKRQTTATNGRVGSLELAKARMEGIHAAYKWIGPLISSMLCGSGVTVLTLLVTGKL